MDNIFLFGEENINDENYINENNIIDRNCKLVQGEDNLKGIYDINKLINKEIKRENILLSSKDIEDKIHDSKTLRFDLTLNNAGGINYKRNVIGFRLNECIFTSPIFNITNNNSQIIYTINTEDNVPPIKIDIPRGFYTINSLINEINDNIDGFVLEFDPTTALISLTNNNSNTITINYVLNNLIYKLGFHDEAKLTTIPSSEGENTIVSDTHPSLNIGTYLDIVVDEIPYGACKQNSKGLNIIHRLPIRPETASSIVYYSSNFIDHNYQHLFSPINLSQLTIHLYIDGNELPLNNLVISFEFELVILNK